MTTLPFYSGSYSFGTTADASIPIPEKAATLIRTTLRTHRPQGQTLAGWIGQRLVGLSFEEAQVWELPITMTASFLVGENPLLDPNVLRACQAVLRHELGPAFFGLFSKVVSRQGIPILKLTIKLNNRTVRSATEFHQFWPTVPVSAPVAVPVAIPLTASCVGRDWMRTPPTSPPCGSEDESPLYAPDIRLNLGEIQGTGWDGWDDWTVAEPE